MVIIRSDNIGGIAQETCPIYEQIAKEPNIDCFMLTSDKYPFDMRKAAPCEFKRANFEHPIAVYREIEKRNPDIVNIDYPGLSHRVMTILLLMALKLKRYKLLWKAHNLLSHQPRPIDLFYFLIIYLVVDEIIFESRENLDAFRTIFKMKKGICIYPCASAITDYGRFTKTKAKKELKLQGKKVVLFFGYIYPYKGLENLIKVMPYVVSKIPESILLIEGYARLGKSRDYVENCLRIAQNLGISGNIRAEIDRVLGLDEIEKFFKAADVIVLPYKPVHKMATFTSFLPFLAAAYHLPIVCTSIEIFQDIVEKEGIGLLTTPDKLGVTIVSLLNDKELRRRIKRNVKRFRSKYSSKRIAEQTIEVFTQLLLNP